MKYSTSLCALTQGHVTFDPGTRRLATAARNTAKTDCVKCALTQHTSVTEDKYEHQALYHRASIIYEVRRESVQLANTQAQYIHSAQVLDEYVLNLGVEAGEWLISECMLIARVVGGWALMLRTKLATGMCICAVFGSRRAKPLQLKQAVP